MGIEGRIVKRGNYRSVRSRSVGVGLIMSGLAYLTVPALGSDDDYGYPPEPTPNIQLETFCVGGCWHQPIEDPPQACDSLVRGNLHDLAGRYEVGVPTADQKCALDETDARLDSIIKTKYQNPFRGPTEFMGTPRKFYHLGDPTPGRIVDAQLTSVIRMKRARSSLIERFDALESALRADNAWPQFATVAPHVWPIRACVAMLDSTKLGTREAYRKFSEQVAAYASSPNLKPFAFYDDWFDFVGTSEKCGKKTDSLITPFFAQPVEAVRESRERLLDTLYTVKNLRQRLAQMNQKVDEAERQLNQRATSETEQIGPN